MIGRGTVGTKGHFTLGYRIGYNNSKEWYKC